MGNFQGGNRGGFRGNDRGGKPDFKKSFNKGGFGGGRGGNDRGPRPDMHKAVCSDCGNNCEVPFRPSSDKPIYCNDCFGSKREGVDRKVRGNFNDRGPKNNFDRPQRAEIARPAPGVNNDAVIKQLSELNTKIDRLISAIDSMPKQTTAVSATPKAKASTAPVAKKVVKAVAKKVVAKAPTKKVVAKKPATKKKSK